MPNRMFNSLVFHLLRTLPVLVLIWGLAVCGAFAQTGPRVPSSPGPKHVLVNGSQGSETPGQTDLASKKVLILHAFAYGQPAYKIIDGTISESFVAAGLDFNNLYFEFMDLARNPGPGYRKELSARYREEFKGRNIDLILTLHVEAFEFLLKDAKDILPDIPIIAIFGPPKLDGPDSKRPITILPPSIDILSTAKDVVRLQPDTRKIVIIAGSGVPDKRLGGRVRAELEKWKDGPEVAYISDLPLDDILKKVTNLPPKTAIFYTTVYADSTGKTYMPRDVARMISKAANAPVFGLFDTLLGDGGVVGGTMFSHQVEGERAARLAIEMLQGKLPPELITISPAPLVPMFDWQQVKRWGLDGSALPPGSIVLNRPSSFWEGHKLAIMVILVFCLMETALILVLILQRRRRMVAEASLRQKKEELEQFFNVSLDLLCVANVEGYFVRLNPSFEKVLGYTPAELMAAPFLEFIHPDDVEATKEAMATLSLHEVLLNFANRYRCKDGTYRWFEWRAVPSGNLIHAAARDVTEHRRVDETLEERLRFERLLSDLSARFVNVAPDQVDSEIDRGLRQILEFFDVERCGLLRTIRDRSAWQITHVAAANDQIPPVPVGVELPRSINPWSYEKIIERGEALSVSRRDDLPPEADVDWQTWVGWGIRSHITIPIFIGESVDYVIVINSLKSERVWPEEFIPRLRLLGEIFANALERKRMRLQLEERLRFEALISDLSGRFVNLPPDEVDSEINKGLLSITEFFDADRCSIGLFSEDGTQLARAFEYHLPEAEPAAGSVSMEQMPWYMEQLIRGNPVVMNRVGDLPPEAEKERQFCQVRGMKSVLSIPMASGGTIMGSCALVSTRAEREWPPDIVNRLQLVAEIFANALARKRAEMEIAVQRNEMAHITRVSTVGQLASSLAHELNQPLGAILRNAEAAELFLQDPMPDLDEVRAILADIRKDDQRAGEVIDRMRGLLKRREVERRRLNINLLAGEVVALVRPDATMRGVRLAVETDPALPSVRGDRVQLQQALLNLLLNAVEAVNENPPANGLVTVRVRPVGATVEVAVSDTGYGIQADNLLRVFEPFFSSKPSGLGMGLAITRSIIEAHGGRLWAENNPDGGATFRFTVPVSGE